MVELEVFTTGSKKGIREDFLQKERLELGGTSLGEQGGEGCPPQ